MSHHFLVRRFAERLASFLFSVAFCAVIVGAARAEEESAYGAISDLEDFVAAEPWLAPEVEFQLTQTE